ncbi:multiple PDZ domain protein-like isoform X3 [Mya arenaria]|uniref:multiple PDZ domain protein-like isoform X3 n=1 Tax=Mya arenaria TaxID=6604 RepID=UPI0022E0A7F8|nr:multiple PDZ domain protein-like isoform X3 [Mya arenaria]
MSLINDGDHAAECLDHLQTLLWESGDHSQDDNVSSLICMLQSPLFRQLLVLQDSIEELKQVHESGGLEGHDVDFLPELQLTPVGHTNPVFEAEIPHTSMLPYQSTPAYNDEFQRVIEAAGAGREIETMKLFKPEKQSLGFSVVANPGDPAIYVQDIQPGGIAERHGRLRERDQLLAIDGQPLDVSHQEAIRILQQTGGIVEIVVARGPHPSATVAPDDQPDSLDQQPASLQNNSEADMLNTEWTQIEVIDLINDGTGLGFGIIGGRSTGVVVKTILPGGVAHVDGRLHSGDHILQIGDVDVRGFASEQVAQVLRQAGSHVRLIVARPINEPSGLPTPEAPIVPTIQLDEHMEQIVSMLEKRDQMMIEKQSEMNQQQQDMMHNVELHGPPYRGEDVPPPYRDEVQPEVVYFDVTLGKDSHQGLGITIAGYIGKDNNPGDLCGIFVKSITPGSAAHQDGQIQVNDQIIEVDGKPLQGYTNHQAVEVLRNTGHEVKLKLARYLHGAKFEQLQHYLTDPPSQPAHQTSTVPVTSSPRSENNSSPPTQHAVVTGVVELEDVSLQAVSDDMDAELTSEIEAAIRSCWEPIIGEEFDIVVAQLSKFKEGSGLGISLEGTVDVENGVEVRPHHYIRAILPDGPVGVNGRLHGGDELLEVNGKRLLGLNHKEVVGILKQLPQNVRLVCARRKEMPNDNYAEEFETPPLNPSVGEVSLERLVKSKSDNALSETMNQSNLSGKKSRSLEPLSGLAMWSEEPMVIELRKGYKGLGFSILDYQDPVNPGETVIVIRSLVPGGVAQMDGRLVPGDRLMFVNDVNLESATLDEAVQALKGAEKGVVQIGVAKPLPLSGGFPEVPVEEELENMFDSEISADTNIATYATQPMHESVSHSTSHNYMNLQDLEESNSLPALAGIVRHQQSSLSSSSSESDSEDRVPEMIEQKVSPSHARTESSDSFYESDKEELSFSTSMNESGARPAKPEKPALKEKPQIKRPVPQPRKQDSVTSYENEDAIQLLKEHEEAIKASQASLSESPLPVASELELSYDYDSSTLPSMEVKQRETTTMQRGESPEMFLYENTSLAPLPSYEEAVSGDAEFFNMDDLEAPPVPARGDSNMVMTQKSGSDSSSSDETNRPQPSPRKITSSEKTTGRSRSRPPVPPKPKSPGKGSPGVKDAPPPLPVSSPPHMSALDEDTKDLLNWMDKTSPTVSDRAPSSDQSTVLEVDLSDRQTDVLNISSSSDQFNTSDLKAVSASSSSTPRTASPGISPITSPSLLRSFSGPDAFPPNLEKRITLKRSHNNLGMTVESTDKGINGCMVKALTKTGAVYKDGQIQVGDYIMSINNESMRRITNTQARVILRRASLMGSTDISINYVTAADGAAHKEIVAGRPPESPNSPHMMPSPNSTLSPASKHTGSTTSEGSNHSNHSSPMSSPRKLATTSPITSPFKTSPLSSPGRTSSLPDSSGLGSQSPRSTPPEVSPRQKETIVVGPGNQTWGPPRLVELYREQGKTLGISIVGGRVDMFHVSEEHMISGIFIKHVLEDSPAGRNGTLKTGDRILTVDGKDLRNATHDQAVETIRHASNPVKFVVQSLTDPACPRDLEQDTKSVQSYDEASQVGLPQSAPPPVPVDEAPIQTSSPVPPTEAPPLTTQSHGGHRAASPSDEHVDEYGYSLERIQRRYGDLNGELLLVELTRGSGGLGISLAGNKDRNTMSVFVAGIQPESAAAHDGNIMVGDELLEVNGNVLYGRSHLNASAIIKGITTQVIKFVLLRRDDNLERMAVKPLKVTSPILKHDLPHEQKQSSPLLSEPATLNPTPSEEKPTPTLLTATHDVIQVISLNKGPNGLGFAIVEETQDGRPGIYVRSITVGGVAAKDGRLTVGDQLLEVQDKNLQDVHYDKAIEILRNMQGTVRLKVRKCDEDGALHAQNNIQGQVTLPNPPGESSTDGSTANQTADSGSHDPLTCPIIPGQEMRITIEKGRTGLGLSIVGGADTLLGAIIIHEVYEDGAAARDGRLWAGDQILEVNHENLREATHDYAIQVLRQTPPSVDMLVFRDDSHVKEEDIYDIFTVDLIKKPGRGLGLSIVGKRNDVGVYISDIVKGGAAESDGRLMQGDQILTVNGEDMRNATQEYAAAVLKTTMGKVALTVGRLKAGSRTSSRKNSNNAGSGLRKSESTASNKSRGGRHSKMASPDSDIENSEDISHIRVIELEHDANGSLGLSIAGGVGSSLGDTPIIVANLTSGGPAERSRKLKVGDRILSVNGVSTEKMDHDQVVSLLKSSQPPITLQVTQGEQTQVSVSGRSSSTRGSTRGTASDTTKLTPSSPQDNNVFEDDDVPPQYKTIVLERGVDGLGFSIVGGHGSPHGDLPIYVKNVFSKGAASENGQLKRGDQILSVNGASLEGLTHEEAVNILKNAKGSVIMNVLS